MKIEDNRMVEMDFFSIQYGECFSVECEYYMKVMASEYNAVSLSKGHCARFYDDDKVIPINAKIVIE